MQARLLIYCGAAAAALYIAMNVFIPFLDTGYDWITQTVSELSAVDAPTRPVWFPLGILYTLLVAAFGWGIVKVAGEKRSLHLAGIFMIINGLAGLAWSPMHQREILAAGGGTFTDTWHIIMAVITVVLMFFSISFGAASFGKAFRLYSIATLVIFIVFGALTFRESPGIDKNLATPHIGIWERINIGAFMIWMLVLSCMLLTKDKGREQRPVLS
jgi:hypothetical protein